MDCATVIRICCFLVVVLVLITATANAAPILEESNISPITQPALSEKDEHIERKMSKRMVLPLLVGILLKVGSLLPIILGKLTLLAVGSIMTSKLALLIAGLLALHKFQSESSWHLPTPIPSEDYTAYGYRRRG